jgi:hypothetical protein
MKNRSSVFIFLDEQTQPLGEFTVPINFELDTKKLVDGAHTLKIVSKDPTGKEGIRNIPFLVRNGPSIAVEGIAENDIVDGVIPIMINAYGKGDQTQFLIDGSETPQSTPAWFWAIIISFVAFAIYYFIVELNLNLWN